MHHFRRPQSCRHIKITAHSIGEPNWKHDCMVQTDPHKTVNGALAILNARVSGTFKPFCHVSPKESSFTTNTEGRCNYLRTHVSLFWTGGSFLSESCSFSNLCNMVILLTSQTDLNQRQVSPWTPEKKPHKTKTKKNRPKKLLTPHHIFRIHQFQFCTQKQGVS